MHINKGPLSHCCSFYCLLTCKMTRIDEFSSGYEPVPKAAAAAVKPYTEMTSCAFKMIHAPVPLSPSLFPCLPARFIPRITPAAASPPAPPRQSGLRLHCQTQLNLQVNWSKCMQRLWCCSKRNNTFNFVYASTPSCSILVGVVLTGTNMWPRSSVQAPMSPHYESSLISLVKTFFIKQDEKKMIN